jgi:acetyl/propionyl-CoA carboxylase alpha subunit
MAKLGSKTAARKLAEAAGVPVVPGAIPDDQSDAAIIAAAGRVGFPVLLKPSEGGGGIGMKEVHTAADLPGAVAQARREAEAAFGDGTLYVERLVTKPRHIEFQVLGDSHGNVVHLFERECSIQRRHQKVLEETPSTAVTPALRARMGAAAVALAKAAVFRFDMSDLQPAAFGATAGQGEWKLFQDFVSKPSDASGIAKKLEASAAAAYK